MIELDAYVDDELPDYIMVMVANDRTQVTLVYVISKNNLHHTNAKKKFSSLPRCYLYSVGIDYFRLSVKINLKG